MPSPSDLEFVAVENKNPSPLKLILINAPITVQFLTLIVFMIASISFIDDYVLIMGDLNLP